jgi:hypothetical protein
VSEATAGVNRMSRKGKGAKRPQRQSSSYTQYSAAVTMRVPVRKIVMVPPLLREVRLRPDPAPELPHSELLHPLCQIRKVQRMRLDFVYTQRVDERFLAAT